MIILPLNETFLQTDRKTEVLMIFFLYLCEIRQSFKSSQDLKIVDNK